MEWQPIETAPDGRPGDTVDLWFEVYASPMSFGMADSYRVVDAWKKDGKWFRFDRMAQRELNPAYITHWMRPPEPPK